MNLSEYKFPDVTTLDMAFPTLNTTKELVQEAEKRTLTKGRAKFIELFYTGGETKVKKDVKGTWKEGAYLYARALMGSWSPKHEHKEAVCAMIFEERLVL